MYFMKKICLCSAFFCTVYPINNKNTTEECLSRVLHFETWWQNNLNTQESMSTFASWLGPWSAHSRTIARNYVIEHKYKTLLDVGCGLCTEYYGYLKSNYAIDYCGIDITKRLVDLAKGSGIRCKQGSVEKIPFCKDAFDVVYARHLLEHLPGYQKALQEMIRVAKKCVIVVFFIKPDHTPEKIDLGIDRNTEIYHNKYNIDEISLFSKKHIAKKPKFVDCSEQESIMIIEK